MSSRDSYHLWITEKVRWADVDAFGHANNNAIGVYFEQVRVAAMDRCGLEDRDRGLHIVLARITIDYLAELKRGDQVDIGLRVSRLGNSSITFDCAAFRGEDCVARSEAVCVLVDTAHRRATPLPDDFRARLSALEGPAA